MMDKLGGFFDSRWCLFKKTLFRIKSILISKKNLIASEPVYNEFFTKIKIKSHSDEVTDIYDQKITRAYSNHTCLAVISLDSTVKPTTLLKEDSGTGVFLWNLQIF